MKRETFFTTGESTDYGVSVHEGARVAHTGACSEPAAKAEAVSCGCPA